jgi:hypothetical protein
VFSATSRSVSIEHSAFDDVGMNNMFVGAFAAIRALFAEAYPYHPIADLVLAGHELLLRHRGSLSLFATSRPNRFTSMEESISIIPFSWPTGSANSFGRILAANIRTSCCRSVRRIIHSHAKSSPKRPRYLS